MSQVATVAAAIFRRAGKSQRMLVAIAGPPGAGKSTFAGQLAGLLPEGSAAVVPMDGFHFDDAVLERRGLRSRKGAPESFDFGGLAALLKRIRAGETQVAYPLFDRSMELSRAGAAVLEDSVRFVIVEGNYLLLDEEPWRGLAELFDFSVFLDVPRPELERRLLQRWHEHGLSEAEGMAKVMRNDLPNADRVRASRRAADLAI